MVVTLLKRLGFGTVIGTLFGVPVALLVLMVRLLDSWMKSLDSRVNSIGVRLVELAHSAYHTLQVELLNAHHAIHVEVRSIHHVIQVDVLRHHELWLIIKGTMTFGDLIMGLGMFLLAASIWMSRAISISLPVKNRQMTGFGPGWRRRGRSSAHNARYFLPDSCYPDERMPQVSPSRFGGDPPGAPFVSLTRQLHGLHELLQTLAGHWTG
jgi:hypothetical protein